MNSELERLNSIVVEISKNYSQLHDQVDSEVLKVLNSVCLLSDDYSRASILDLVNMLVRTLEQFVLHTAELLQLIEHDKGLPLMEWQRRYEQLLNDVSRDKAKLSPYLQKKIHT